MPEGYQSTFLIDNAGQDAVLWGVLDDTALASQGATRVCSLSSFLTVDGDLSWAEFKFGL